MMNDDELIRYIRRCCGDEVADAITDLIYATSIRAQLADLISRVCASLHGAEEELSDAGLVLDEMRGVVMPQ